MLAGALVCLVGLVVAQGFGMALLGAAGATGRGGLTALLALAALAPLLGGWSGARIVGRRGGDRRQRRVAGAAGAGGAVVVLSVAGVLVGGGWVAGWASAAVGVALALLGAEAGRRR